MLALLSLLACGPSEPQAIADCAQIADGTAREECRMGFAAAQLDDLAAMRALIAEVDEVESRDLLRLRLAVRDPVRAGGLCKDAETPPAQQRCEQVLGRPHLRAPRPE